MQAFDKGKKNTHTNFKLFSISFTKYQKNCYKKKQALCNTSFPILKSNITLDFLGAYQLHSHAQEQHNLAMTWPSLCHRKNWRFLRLYQGILQIWMVLFQLLVLFFFSVPEHIIIIINNNLTCIIKFNAKKSFSKNWNAPFFYISKTKIFSAWKCLA